MTTGTNTTLKGSIAFGAIIIGAAIVFASSQEDAADTSDQTQDEAAAKVQYAPGSQAQRRVEDAEQIEADGEDDLLEWGEEALLDDTAGFDPTPGGEMGSNDDDFADVYVEVENSPRPRSLPRSGSETRTNTAPVANAPAISAPAAPSGRAAPSESGGAPAPGGRVGIPSNGELPS